MIKFKNNLTIDFYSYQFLSKKCIYDMFWKLISELLYIHLPFTNTLISISSVRI